MAYEIRVPEVSEGVTEGTVVSIAVTVGDRVEVDQTLLELETDKAVIAIPSTHQGTIDEIKVAAGDTVAIGAVIMAITSREAVKSSAPGKAEADVQPEDVDIKSTEPPVSLSSSLPSFDSPVELLTEGKKDPVAPSAPSVRRLARELGVDIFQVQGTGPRGRISAEDVHDYVRLTMQGITGGSASTVHGEFPGLHAQRLLPDFSRWGEVTREPLSKIRTLTADAMSYAWSTIPMVTQYDSAVISDVESFRKEYNRQIEIEQRLTMTAIMVKVCAAALKAFPHFNSSLDLSSKELVLKSYVHIGVAVDTPSGLLVPVIRDADQKGLEKLAFELNGVAGKARERKVIPADMEGGTFTISNLGGVGGSAFTPIVYAPQVAILGISTAKLSPQWDGSQFVPKLVMPLSLSYDHRVIDGADGARFLRWICEALEQPMKLVMRG